MRAAVTQAALPFCRTSLHILSKFSDVDGNRAVDFSVDAAGSYCDRLRRPPVEGVRMDRVRTEPNRGRGEDPVFRAGRNEAGEWSSTRRNRAMAPYGRRVQVAASGRRPPVGLGASDGGPSASGPSGH